MYKIEEYPNMKRYYYFWKRDKKKSFDIKWNTRRNK